MYNPFQRNKLGIDTELHCHILPTIDCDPEFITQALAVLKVFQYFGISTVYTTPHIRLSRPSNTHESIMERKKIFKKHIEESKLNIHFEVTAEYCVDDGFIDLIEQGELLTYPGNYVLLELQMRKKPQHLKETIKKLTDKGYKPIIGHPELHNYLRYDWREITTLREMGCYFQLNLIDMTGYFGEEAIAASINLLRSNTYTFVGTGAHSREQLRLITEGLLQNKYYVSLLNNVDFKNSIFSKKPGLFGGLKNGDSADNNQSQLGALWEFFKKQI